MAWSAAVGFLLHSAAVLWIWQGWAAGSRAAWLVWMDLPLSLAWLHSSAPTILVLSLGLGGLWWGAVTAALVGLVGRLTAAR